MVWTYSGVRPLLDDDAGDPSAVTRDYLLELDTRQAAPLLSVWGGKITTFRKLAEEAADLLRPHARPTPPPAGPTAPYLPGGDLRAWIGARARGPTPTSSASCRRLQQRHPWLPEALLHRLARAYGARIELAWAMRSGWPTWARRWRRACTRPSCDYLHRHEWAASADDVLWRRTKLGLHCTEAERQAVAGWFERIDATLRRRRSTSHRRRLREHEKLMETPWS